MSKRYSTLEVSSRQAQSRAKTGLNVTDTLGRSRAGPGAGFLGNVPKEVWEVVERSWAVPFSISSNYSRQNRHAVALATPLGWITIITPDGLEYTNDWHVTAEGLMSLQRHLKGA